MQLTWYGHATWGVEIGPTRLIIDPFFKGNPAAPVSSAEISADYLVVTHGHGDHLGDTLPLARRTGALVIANAEICDWLERQGLEKLHPLHIGGGYHFPFGYLKLTQAVHGSGLPDGSYGGNPAGILIDAEGRKLYHAGDTGLFADMALIGEEGLDTALLPIGDNYTMGPDDALRAVKLLHPRVVIPMHFNTWGLIRQDSEAWGARVRTETQTQPILLQPGESYTMA